MMTYNASFSLMIRITTSSTRQTPVWCPTKMASAVSLHWEPHGAGHTGHWAMPWPITQHQLLGPKTRTAPRKCPRKFQSTSAPSSSLGATLSLQRAHSHRPAEASWGPQSPPRLPLSCLTAIQTWHQISEGWWDDTRTTAGMTESAPSCCRLLRLSKYLALPGISLCAIWYLRFASLNFN